MDFQLSQEQKTLKNRARRIAEEELADDAFTYEGKYPMDKASVLADAGLLGISLPDEYGGSSMTPLEVLMVQEEIGRVCPDTAHLISHTSMGAPRAIDHLGSEKLKEKYLPGICNGDYVVAVAISEAEAGSAANDMQTRAEDDNNTIVINGEKSGLDVQKLPKRSSSTHGSKKELVESLLIRILPASKSQKHTRTCTGDINLG
ncbi:acyl-CoA dehydrogenase family protein [Halalkalicoccus salilacus]|uniref:acyl-CoA dehydrogenase family protein n=1 Tax=Halalkalicoccus sp. GCM10025704 TaxID=3252662 RepID=UPI003609D89C